MHPYLTCGMLAFAAITLLVQDSTVLLPAITLSVGNPTVLAFFTPVIVVGTLAEVLDNRLISAEESGTRPVRWMDTALIAAAMGAATAVSVMGGWATGSEAVLAAGRNTCFLVGMMLCARFFVRRSGIILPLAWIFAVVFFGRRTGTTYYEWALTAQPHGSVLAAASAAAALALGLLLTYHSRNPL
ncbi:hypothetical protein [Streptomyces sp. 7N604]|uniref:hypothetical protein n=1 Tax=Streptomyces sp. 7N604 TaxID=3457415 RepID=UPI003FD29F71